jgi:hypothetical protein
MNQNRRNMIPSARSTVNMLNVINARMGNSKELTADVRRRLLESEHVKNPTVEAVVEKVQKILTPPSWEQKLAVRVSDAKYIHRMFMVVAVVLQCLAMYSTWVYGKDLTRAPPRGSSIFRRNGVNRSLKGLLPGAGMFQLAKQALQKVGLAKKDIPWAQTMIYDTSDLIKIAYTQTHFVWADLGSMGADLVFQIFELIAIVVRLFYTFRKQYAAGKGENPTMRFVKSIVGIRGQSTRNTLANSFFDLVMFFMSCIFIVLQLTYLFDRFDSGVVGRERGGQTMVDRAIEMYSVCAGLAVAKHLFNPNGALRNLVAGKSTNRKNNSRVRLLNVK